MALGRGEGGVKRNPERIGCYFKKIFLKNTWDKKVKVISLKLKTRMVGFNILYKIWKIKLKSSGKQNQKFQYQKIFK